MIKNIHVFGATTLTGEFLIRELENKIPNLKIFHYSRRNKKNFYIDLEKNIYNILLPKEDHVIINIGPIWIFADFFSKVLKKDPLALRGLKGVITCSSSSLITKRNSRNKFDKDLIDKLYNSEEKLKNICDKKNILLSIVRPTLIYGKSINKVDKNINLILKILRITPLIIFPKNSGLRQPLHAKQLSEVLASLTLKTINKELNKLYIVNVGGDEVINYLEMINRIRSELVRKDNAKKLIILKIPNKIFFLILYPINIVSPKIYGAILRLSSNLSGFTKASQISGEGEERFPIKPYY